MNKRFYTWFFLILTTIFLVVTNDISRFIDKATVNSGFLRKSILRIANVAIPLKNKILKRTVDDYMAQLQSTGVCQFCNFTEVAMNRLELREVDMRNSNLNRANFSGMIIGSNAMPGNDIRAIYPFKIQYWKHSEMPLRLEIIIPVDLVNL